jgi:oligopeptide transport system substrate-binding protein
MNLSYFPRLVVVVLLCLGFANPAWAQRRERADFRFINRNDVITLDLNQMSYLQDFRVTFAIREGLYGYNPETMVPEPAIAVSAESSADKRVWVFKLRPEAKWSNGDAVTAGDFVFSWKYMLQAPGEYTSLFYYIKNAEAYQKAYAEGKLDALPEVGFRAVDAHTLELTLSDPVPFLLDLLAFPPFYPRHEKSMEPFKATDEKGRVTYDARYTRPAEKAGGAGVVLNGPFNLEAWDFGKSLFFRKNEHYWDKANVKSNTLEMVVNSNPQSAFIMYEQKQVDWLTDPQPNIAVNLKKQGRKDLVTGPGFGTHFVTVNVLPEVAGVFDGKNPLADVRVRQALAMATDREQLTRDITRMGEVPATNYIPPDAFAEWGAGKGFGQDVEKAKALLAEAGYPGGKGLPTLPIIFNTDSPVRQLVAQALKSQWEEKLGIRVEAVGMELKGYRQALQSKKYGLGLVAWFGDYLDPSTFTDKYRSTSENNDSGWNVPEYDAMLDAAAKELDPVKRKAILVEAENMINRELPIIPLWHAVGYTLRRENVRGLFMNKKQLTMWKPVEVVR